MPKKIVIIGAGIAGLAAGCYARMNGYEAEIYEMHDKAGGLCTSWNRKGYTFDGCIHWMLGSSPNHEFYEAWEELGALPGRNVINPDIFYRYHRPAGYPLVLYSDVNKLEAHMIGLFPEDREPIQLLCKFIRKMTHMKIPWKKAYELFTIFDIISLMFSMLPVYGTYQFCSKTTMEEFAQRFTDPFLREVVSTLFGSKEYTLMSIVSTMALLHNECGGYPVGGSRAFIEAVEKRLLDLGGRIFYQKKVEKILEENGQATGIRLTDGTEISGDYVISAADMHTTLYSMMEGKHIDPLHEELFRSIKLSPSTVQISFGINMEISAEVHSTGDFYQPGNLAGHDVTWLMVKDYSMDPTMAPKGKSVVICMGRIEDYDYWEKLSANKQAYEAEKEKIAAAVADFLEEIYPGCKAAIEVQDVATPVTYTHYTGSYRGTYMTWLIPPERSKEFQRIPKTVPGLKNFWMSGMWVQAPGGLPSGVISSRHIMQVICKQDGKKFEVKKA